MRKKFSLLDRLAHRRYLRRWTHAARLAETAELADLRQIRGAARMLRARLDRVLFKADERLALPALGSQAFPRPHDCDWAWRPELWRAILPKPGLVAAPNKGTIGSEITLFHDCETSEITLRQLRNQREEDLAPYGLHLDVLNFDGSFMSLVLGLPAEACQGMSRGHLMRIDFIVEMEYPIEIFARLNVQHGPNSEQLVRELPLSGGDRFVEFDLAYTKLNEKRVERAWVDLIFERPSLNKIILRDLTFARRPRAPL